MKVRCPHCDQQIDPHEIRMEFGGDPGPKCPECGGLVRPYRPHRNTVFVSALLLGVLTMEFFSVKSPIWFVLGVAMLWVPFALGLNILLQRGKPFKLEAVTRSRSRPGVQTRRFK